LIIFDFFYVLTNPIKLKLFKNITFQQIIGYFFTFFFILIFSSTFIALFVYDSKVNNLKSITPTYFFSCLIIPIYEEVIFRLFIRKSLLNYILLTFFIMIMLVNYFLKLDFTNIILIVFLLFLIVRKVINENETEYNNKLTLVMVYSSLLLFSITHIFNMKIIELNILSLLIIINYLISGIIFTVFRLRFGIVGSILFHIIINSIAFFIS